MDGLKKKCSLFSKEHGVSAWKSPQFLFVVMGVIIIVTMIITYILGTRYLVDPLLVLGIVVAETVILFIIGFFIVRSFENLVKANAIKSDFLNLVSHQLHTPLTAIKWSIEELKNDVQLEENKSILQMEKSVNRMADLASKFLMAPRVEEKGMVLYKKSFSLEDRVREILASGFSGEEKITFSVESEESLPNIYSDPEQVSVVIENLISNAVKYSPEEGGEVKIRIQKRGKDILLEVEDEGIGVPPKEQKNIFDKFYRAENAMNTKREGSGLGLFLCREIIYALGGKIGFDYAGENGSVFWFKLPIK